MIAAVPDRSTEQRRAALQLANDVRGRRARLKESLRAGDTTIAGLIGLLADPPSWLETARIADVLLAVPGMGSTKVNRVVSRVGMSASKTFGGLSDRQRAEVVSVLRERLR